MNFFWQSHYGLLLKKRETPHLGILQLIRLSILAELHSAPAAKKFIISPKKVAKIFGIFKKTPYLCNVLIRHNIFLLGRLRSSTPQAVFFMPFLQPNNALLYSFRIV